MSRGSANKAAGKVLERLVAARFGEQRYPADTGGPIDVEGTCVWSAKHVQVLSLAALSRECQAIAAQGTLKGKPGLVAAKVRQGRGAPSEPIVAMTWGTFEAFLEAFRGARP